MLFASIIIVLFISHPVSAAGVNTTLNLNSQWVSGNISNSEDIDVYTFTMPKAGWAEITYQGLGISYSYYSIYTPDQTNRLAYNSVYSSSNEPSTEVTKLALNAGNYIIKVQAGDSYSGDYRIKGSYIAADITETEPNDSFQTAMAIAPDTYIKSFFSLTDDYDYYTFTITSECNIDVTVTASTYLSYSLWNQDLINQKSSSVSGNENNPSTSKISKVTLTPGKYYIKCDSSNTGSYNIKWSLSPIPMTDIVISGNKDVVAGKTIQLSAMAVPANTTDKRIVWESSNTQVATVDFNTGLVTTLAAGTATITAKSVDGSNIKKPEVIIVTPKKMSKPKVKAGKNKKITISWKPVTGLNYDIQYGTKSNFKKAKTRSYSMYYKKVTLKMKKKGTYYVRIRATTDLFGKKVCGAWSKSSKVKAK